MSLRRVMRSHIVVPRKIFDRDVEFELLVSMAIQNNSICGLVLARVPEYLLGGQIVSLH